MRFNWHADGKSPIWRNLAAISMFAAPMCGCGGLELASKWPVAPVVVNADLTSWPDSTWVDKDGVRFSMMNDSDYCYVEIVVVKPEIRRQIMARGLTVWCDPLGNEKKSVGFRYPLGMAEERGSYERDPSMAQSSLAASQAEFEYISPLQPDRLRVPVIASRGVEIKINNMDEAMVYQLKAPLHTTGDHPYTFESSSGSKISLGIEIGGMSRPQGSERSGDEGGGFGSGGFGGGGRRGGGGGGRGRGAGGSRSGGSSGMSPVEVWASVQLAPASK